MNRFTLIFICALCGFLGGKLTESRAADIDSILLPAILEKINLSKIKYTSTSGYSITKKPPNTVWWQDGYTYDMNLTGDAKNKALTMELTTWLKLEANYFNFGESNGSVTFVSDENYSSNPTSPCRNPCEAARTATWVGTAKGVGASLIPTYTTDSGSQFGMRVGALHHEVRTLVTAKNFHDPFVNDPNPSVGIYDMPSTGWGFYYGAQAEVNKILVKKDSFKFQYIDAPRVRCGDCVQRGVKFLSITYKAEF